jgi:hypothetical protein
LVNVNYEDGNQESFLLTPGNYDYDPTTGTFVVQHAYNAIQIYKVDVTIQDGSGAMGTTIFPVTVYQAPESARVAKFVVALADNTGQVTSDLRTDDGSVHLDSVLSHGQPGDAVALADYAGNPTVDRTAFQGQEAIAFLDHGRLGTALPLSFVDARTRIGAGGTLTFVCEVVVPDAQAVPELQLFWFDPQTDLFEALTSIQVLTVTPIRDALGHRTGESLVHFEVTIDNGSQPTLAQLTGTVFSVGVVVAGGGNATTSATVSVPTQVASQGPVGVVEIEVETTGFGGGSQVTMTLQVSQSRQTVNSSSDSHSAAGNNSAEDTASNPPTFLQWLWKSIPGLGQPATPPSAPANTPMPPMSPGHDLPVPAEEEIRNAVDALFSRADAPGLGQEDVELISAGRAEVWALMPIAAALVLATPPCAPRRALPGRRAVKDKYQRPVSCL